MGNLIQVPYIAQPKNSAKCGAACAAMVIKYYTGSKISVDEIWREVLDISPELSREYCRTSKIAAYIARSHFNCSSIQYSSLKELLVFCNQHGIAPIINHKSFENNTVGHFSIVKNILNDNVVVVDPENKNRIVIPLTQLALNATKNNPSDEVGGNTAIVPFLEKFDSKTRICPNCKSTIDISFSCASNKNQKIVVQDLCLYCDNFSPTIF